MRDAPAGSPMAPTVHVYTAAMRAATEGGRWARALDIWEDMRRAGCQPTGHAYAAAISACAAGQDWMRAIALFDDMSGRAGIRPDVVSCTALVTALASAGEADKAEAVVQWMLSSGLKPNVRTYTALLTAMGNARQWARAVEALFMMQRPESGAVQPNAYTYSALLKSLGEHGQWQLAEAVFAHLEAQVRAGAGPQQPAQLHPQVQAAAQQRLAAVAAAAEVAQHAADAQAAAAAAILQNHDPTTGLPAGMATTVTAHPTSLSSSATSSPTGMSPSASLASFPITAFNSTSTSVSGAGAHSSSGATAVSSLTSTATPSSAGSSIANSRVPSSVSLSSAAANVSSMPASADVRVEFGAPRNWSSPAQLNGLSLDLGLTHVLPTQPQLPVAALPHLHTAAVAGNTVPSLGGYGTPQLPSVLAGGAAAVGGALGVPVPADPSFSLFSEQPAGSAKAGVATAGGSSGSSGPGAHAPLVNEVVCGALMLAYERAGKWSEAINVLSRARAMGIQPNAVMYNTAIAAAGKAGHLDAAERLFTMVPNPDGVTHESLVAAYGMAGLPEKAEAVFRLMVQRQFRPRDYAYCGLIAAYSLAGDCEAALRVRKRMRRDGATATVHVYNALLAACERARQYERALELLQAMKREGVEPNMVTQSLMTLIGRQGVQSVEGQQVAAAAWSAVFAAAGTLLIRAGMF